MTTNKLTLQTRKEGGGSRIELKCFIFYGGQPKILSKVDKSRHRSIKFFVVMEVTIFGYKHKSSGFPRG